MKLSAPPGTAEVVRAALSEASVDEEVALAFPVVVEAKVSLFCCTSFVLVSLDAIDGETELEDVEDKGEGEEEEEDETEVVELLLDEVLIVPLDTLDCDVVDIEVVGLLLGEVLVVSLDTLDCDVVDIDFEPDNDAELCASVLPLLIKAASVELEDVLDTDRVLMIAELLLKDARGNRDPSSWLADIAWNPMA